MATLHTTEGEDDPVVLAINAASCALALSGLPSYGPCGAVRIARIGDEFVVNPTRTQLSEASEGSWGLSGVASPSVSVASPLVSVASPLASVASSSDLPSTCPVLRAVCPCPSHAIPGSLYYVRDVVLHRPHFPPPMPSPRTLPWI